MSLALKKIVFDSQSDALDNMLGKLVPYLSSVLATEKGVEVTPEELTELFNKFGLDDAPVESKKKSSKKGSEKHTCEAIVKKTGDICGKKAEHENDGKHLCGTHNKKPSATEKKSAPKATAKAEVKTSAASAKASGKSASTAKVDTKDKAKALLQKAVSSQKETWTLAPLTLKDGTKVQWYKDSKIIFNSDHEAIGLCRADKTMAPLNDESIRKVEAVGLTVSADALLEKKTSSKTASKAAPTPAKKVPSKKVAAAPMKSASKKKAPEPEPEPEEEQEEEPVADEETPEDGVVEESEELDTPDAQEEEEETETQEEEAETQEEEQEEEPVADDDE